MGGREHYSYRNRYKTHLLLSFKESFFFLTSNKLLNKCLKCLKRLEVLLSTFRESNGTEQWPHTNRPPLYRGGSIDLPRSFPPMYKRNLRHERYVENISRTRPERNCTKMGLEGRSAIPWPAEETELSITPAKSCFLMHDPRLLVRSSSPHSMRLAATYKYLAVPRVLVSS
jgi:hypothetical protein